MASVALLQFQLFAAEDITCNVLVNILSFVRFGIHLIIIYVDDAGLHQPHCYVVREHGFLRLR